jgi:hypothetical protein
MAAGSAFCLCCGTFGKGVACRKSPGTAQLNVDLRHSVSEPTLTNSHLNKASTKKGAKSIQKLDWPAHKGSQKRP